MKKFLLIAAAAALALTACDKKSEPAAQANDDAIGFDSYVVTPSRTTELLDNTSIKTTGFGVYAYAQGTRLIEDYTNSNIALNFFNNQLVTWDAINAKWTYSNVKYWPNTLGSMLSFYAYAPYNASIATTMGANPRLILTGDNNGPALYYRVPSDLSQIIDLCWGAEYGVTPALAPVNKTKPAIATNIHFHFYHALARLGFNVQVWADELTDDPTCDAAGTGNNPLEPNTTIKITSVKLLGNFANEGILRLYDGSWNAQNATTADYELRNQFSPAVAAGLTLDDAKAEIPLFADADTYVMMIPGGEFKIQVEYDVITTDANLLNGKSTVHNVVTSDDVFYSVAGVSTMYHLNIGMTSVKFEATVEDWVNSADVEVDLPNNF